ncbi:MAG TPA: DUF6259 domain-containing protein [Armatimonadota bacterium]|nr:DUF6259 domain-containing protein [Armatimonadota bacterium]
MLTTYALIGALAAGGNPAATIDATVPDDWQTPLVLTVDVDGLRVLAGADDGTIPRVYDAERGPCATQVLAGLAGPQLAWLPPVSGERRFEIRFEAGAEEARFGQLTVEETDGEIRVSTGAFTAVHSLTANAGALARIEYADGGEPDVLQMCGDRIGIEGMYFARDDRSPRVEIIDQRPLACTVRAHAMFCDAAGAPAPGRPEVTYLYTYFAGSPLVRIEALVTQPEPRSWGELNLFQRVYKKLRYPSWIVSSPDRTGTLTGANASYVSTTLAGMFDARHAIGLMGMPCRIYDEDLALAGGWGSYIHGPWVTMSDTRYHCSGWLYVGPSGGDGSALTAQARALEALRLSARVRPLEFEVERIRDRLPRLRGRARLLTEAALGLTSSVVGDLSDLERSQEAVKHLAALVSGEGPEAGSQQVVGNDLMSVLLGPAEDGFPVRGLRAANGDRDFGPGAAGGGLWRLRFRDEAGTIAEVTSASPSEHEADGTEDGRKLKLRWRGIAVGDEPRAADVEVSARIGRGARQSLWSIRVKTLSTKWALWEIDFPYLSGLRVDPDAGTVAYPRFLGYLERKPLINESPDLIYPSHAAEMQMSSVQSGNSALYFATYDGAAWHKRFKFRPEEGRSLSYIATHYPPYTPGKPGTFELPYETAIGVFEGDWIDSCELYRQWALQQQWCQLGPLAERKDIPKWFVDLGAWFVSAPSDQAIERSKAVGVPMAIQRYGWHQIPFDDDYPDYFPAKDEFPGEIQRMHAGGIRVVPYINGRLWDTDTESFANEGAQQSCTKDVNQERYIENWGQQNHSVQCPSTANWQRKVAGIVERMARELDVDGVYIDQIASYYPMRCFDPTHPHAAGTGEYWVPSYRKLVELCQQRGRAAKPDLALTTEDHAEPFLDLFDGCLTCNAAFAASGLIPMFHHVYSGYGILYGRYNTPPDSDEHALTFRQKNAQMLVWGTQIGWLDDTQLGHREEETAYFAALAKAYLAARPFCLYGRMLRPMVMAGDAPELSAEWHPGQVATMPAVLHSAWESREGELGLIATNTDTVPHTVSLRVPRGWTTDRVTGLEEVYRSGDCIYRVEGGRRVRLTLPARGIVVLRLEA